MGSLQSSLSPEFIAASVLIISALAGYYAFSNDLLPSFAERVSSGPNKAPKDKAGKRNKKKKVVGGGTSLGDQLLTTVAPVNDDDDLPSMPGAVSSNPLVSSRSNSPAAATPSIATSSTLAPPKEKKRKIKKTSSNASIQLSDVSSSAGPSKLFPPSSNVDVPKTSNPKLEPASHGVPQDSWTRVENRRSKPKSRVVGDASDAGITTSVTEEEESIKSAPNQPSKPERSSLEKLLPKQRKTAVDDMLEEGTQPGMPLVMRIESEAASSDPPAARIQPSSTDRPADGFSWGDYEDVADGEDAEAGWIGVSHGKSKIDRNVSSSATSSTPSSISKAPAAPLKKQRQNAAKRQRAKSSKEEAEAQRMVQLAKHKKELETSRMEEQSKAGKNLSGGMKASVDGSGSLVWD